MENLYEPDCIRTRSGVYFNVFEPDPDKINIEDIAHALSMQCRFGGHLQEFYSVAEHSVLCSQLALDYPLELLMHDATEGYLLDLPSPIKHKIPQYKEIENKLAEVIAKKFGFQFPFPEEVHKVDRLMLEIEWEEVHIGLSTGNLHKWNQPRAKIEFMDRFRFLTN